MIETKRNIPNQSADEEHDMVDPLILSDVLLSLRSSIKSREQLAVNGIKNRMALEFELRMTERHTPVFLQYVNSNVTLSQYHTITEPTLVTAVGSSSSIGWCPRVRPEERDDFIEKAKMVYDGTLIDYEITVGNGEGELFHRYVDDEDIFPLLYSNPITLTYTGLDFRVPNHPIDAAISTRRPVSTNKVILSEFGGLSEFVDENYEPIGDEENPISFIVFHAVFDENDDVAGVVGSTFEPRGFISTIINYFTDYIAVPHKPSGLPHSAIKPSKKRTPRTVFFRTFWL